MRFMRPVADHFPVSSPFGKTRIIKGKLDVHKGTDFAVPIGTPIYAAIDGLVQRAGFEDEYNAKHGFGLRIMQRVAIDGVTYFLWYGHCNQLLVKEGAEIRRGQMIALSGNTGNSTGPHTHFGLRRADSDQFIGCEFDPCVPLPGQENLA